MRAGFSRALRTVPLEWVAAGRMGLECEFSRLAGSEFYFKPVAVQMQFAWRVAGDAQAQRIAFFDFEQTLVRRQFVAHDGQIEVFFGRLGGARAGCSAHREDEQQSKRKSRGKCVGANPRWLVGCHGICQNRPCKDSKRATVKSGPPIDSRSCDALYSGRGTT